VFDIAETKQPILLIWSITKP